MRVSQARELFRQITAQYFSGATVVFSNQSRSAKPDLGLVVISPGNLKRPYLPNVAQVDDTMIGHYQSRLTITVDLFTNGTPVYDDLTGEIAAYENTALDDMLSFADYLNSDFVTEWSSHNDVSILLDGDAQDLTGVINDNNYEYRARITVLFFFTQRSVGFASVLGESSIKYPVFEIDELTGEVVRDSEGRPVVKTDESTGEPLYTATPPAETVSTFDSKPTLAEEIVENAIIEPVFNPTSTGGGNGELASREGGYFTDVQIKEEKA